MPDHPWEIVKVDFYGPLPSEHYAVVVIDCYSRFPEVEILKSISAKKVIPKLDSIFARHGIPAQLVSDNGPPFQWHECNQYMTDMGIKHSTSTPSLKDPRSPRTKIIKSPEIPHFSGKSQRRWQEKMMTCQLLELQEEML